MDRKRVVEREADDGLGPGKVSAAWALGKCRSVWPSLACLNSDSRVGRPPIGIRSAGPFRAAQI